MSTSYIISKSLDPIFAISVGAAAAAVRIRREEHEKGHSNQEILNVLRRRINLVLAGPTEELAKDTVNIVEAAKR